MSWDILVLQLSSLSTQIMWNLRPTKFLTSAVRIRHKRVELHEVRKHYALNLRMIVG